MAERTRRKAPTKKTEVVETSVKTRGRQKKTVNPITNFILAIKKRLNFVFSGIQKMPRYQQWLLVLILVAIGLAYYFKGFFVAALVNGQPILRWSVITEVEKQGGQEVLDRKITEALIFQEARAKGVAVTPQEIDEEMKKQEEAVKDEGNFDQLLASYGLTREKFRENIRLNKTITKLVGEISVSEEEIQRYLEENKDTLPKDKSEEEIKNDAREKLKSEKRSAKAQELVSQLRKDAKINVFVTY